MSYQKNILITFIISETFMIITITSGCLGLITIQASLTINGLILEADSVLVVIMKYFLTYYEILDDMGMSMKPRSKKSKNEGILVMFLLIVGMFLQAIATLIF